VAAYEHRLSSGSSYTHAGYIEGRVYVYNYNLLYYSLGIDYSAAPGILTLNGSRVDANGASPNIGVGKNATLNIKAAEIYVSDINYFYYNVDHDGLSLTSPYLEGDNVAFIASQTNPGTASFLFPGTNITVYKGTKLDTSNWLTVDNQAELINLAKSEFIHTYVEDSGFSNGSYPGLTVASGNKVELNSDGLTSIIFNGDVAVQGNAELAIPVSGSNSVTLKGDKKFIIGAKPTGAKVNIDDLDPAAGLISFGAYELTNTGSGNGNITATGDVEFKDTTIALGSLDTYALTIGSGLKLGNQAAGSGVYTITPAYYSYYEPVEFDAGGAGKITVPGIYSSGGTAGELALSSTAKITLGGGSIELGSAGASTGLNGTITLDNGARLAGLASSFYEITSTSYPLPPGGDYIVGIRNEANGGENALFASNYYTYSPGDPSTELAPTTLLSLVAEDDYSPFVISGSTKIIQIHVPTP
jgi:hypothetical protein